MCREEIVAEGTDAALKEVRNTVALVRWAQRCGREGRVGRLGRVGRRVLGG